MAQHVFVSYAHQDRGVADQIVEDLESHGFRCWIAPRDIPGGEDYAQCIVKGIDEAVAMVVVFTQGANESAHLSREVERAVNNRLTIVPVRVEDVVPSGSMQYFLNSVQWLDAFEGPLAPHLASLRRSLEPRHSGTEAPSKSTAPPPSEPAPPPPASSAPPAPPPSPPTPDPAPTQSGRPSGGRSKVLLGSVVLVLGLALGGYFVLPSGDDPPSPPEDPGRTVVARPQTDTMRTTPTPAPPPPAPDRDSLMVAWQQEVELMLYDWTVAWAENVRSVDSYATFYDSTFNGAPTSTGASADRSPMDHDAWIADKRRRGSQVDSISVLVGYPVEVSFDDDLSGATAAFWQTYRSFVDGTRYYCDQGRKTLTLVRRSAEWKIVAESQPSAQSC